MFVDWEAPGQVTKPLSIVPVHGGTYQELEWLETPDGRPGWGQRLLKAGYAVLIVDRPDMLDGTVKYLRDVLTGYANGVRPEGVVNEPHEPRVPLRIQG